MKKTMGVFIAMAILTACATAPIRTPVQGWSKEGATGKESVRDFQECRGYTHVKDGMTFEEFQDDWQFCTDSSIAREKHLQTAQMVLGFSVLVIGPAASLTSLALQTIPTADYRDRCMKKKGYEKQGPKAEEEVVRCMREKGYEWK